VQKGLMGYDQPMSDTSGLKWRERLTVAKELALFATGIGLVMVVVMGFLNFLTDECQRGTPRLTAIFNCFQQH
jgi:hypothetical protein